jgi:hypothetical protein
LASWRSMMKIEGSGSGSQSGFWSGSQSGSISQKHGSADPDTDPHQNVMDPQHCYKDTKTTCRHLKNWPSKRICDRCLLEFIHWRRGQSCWYFRPSFVNYCPYNLLSVHLPHPPPPPLKVQYRYSIQTVCGREGVGMLSPVGDHILQEFNTLYLTGSEPTKLLDHPK